MRTLWAFVIVVWTASSLNAATITFDFSNGIGNDFTLMNTGGIFSIDADGPTLSIAKGRDDGTIGATSEIDGGAVSVFRIDGNFTVTVEFVLNAFPYPDANQQINASVLALVNENGDLTEVLRFRLNSRDRAEIFSSLPFEDTPINTGAMSGRYRLVRNGTTVTAFMADGNGPFIQIANSFDFDGMAQVRLLAIQGTNIAGGPRATTAIDVEFDNLVIEADRIIGLAVEVPEPASFAVWGVLGVIVAVARRRRLYL